MCVHTHAQMCMRVYVWAFAFARVRVSVYVCEHDCMCVIVELGKPFKSYFLSINKYIFTNDGTVTIVLK